jgi:hypothetical protein
MHHFIYPSKDTFITNRDGQYGKNFGVDEILQIGTTNKPVVCLSPTKDYVYTDTIFNGIGVQNFGGYFTGSFGGTVASSDGIMSGSILMFSASYFSGSVDGVVIETSGSISGSLIDGIISGSIIAPYVSGLFVGEITGAVACLTGTGSGVDTRAESNWITTNGQFVNRSLLTFNIQRISESIASGDISNPRFLLNLKVCDEYELPITYTIYAYPISQSWVMGNGYWLNGGSSEGVSWNYRDRTDGTPWYTASISTPKPAIDFVSNPSLLTASFGYGGGTWYTSSCASQSFSYQPSDICMDVTPIVTQWLNGDIPNNGFILLSSDELLATGSGFTLKFFSKDTNTIYSPYLDIAWNDAVFTTGSISTGSVQISTINPGISASIQSGSSMNLAGGINGCFSSSVILSLVPHYILATDQIFDYSAPNSQANNVWWANNGYHYDSWESAWDLDPYHGGFLPNTDITMTVMPNYGSPPVSQFTGSFVGSFMGTASYAEGTISGSMLIFDASYFTGSIDGVSGIETSGAISGSLIDGFISGTIIAPQMIGVFDGMITSSIAYLNGTGSGTYLDSTFQSFTGFANGAGLSGNIIGVPVFGSTNGLIALSQSLITGSCGTQFYTYLAKAIFTDGPFSGSTFTAYYNNNKFENALLTGSWNEVSLLGAHINIPLPSQIDPYVYAYVYGPYISGTAMGTYTISGSVSESGGSNSASFNGQFIDGVTLGASLRVQLSGSIYTSSYNYTSSIAMTSSVFNALDIERPFSINLQSLQPQYKSGDMVKIYVFGRKKYPQKYFGRSTQQEQYMIPESLPSSSFFALKDNQTDEIVINFDEFTQISCEYPYGNFFYLDTTGLPQERYYRILIQVNNSDSSYTIDTGKIFKIVRGSSKASPAWSSSEIE